MAFREKLLDESLLFVEPASEHHPQALRSVNHLDTVFHGMAPRRATEALEKASSGCPIRSHVGAYGRRLVALCYLREGRLDEALSLLRQVLDQTGSREMAQAVLGNMAAVERRRGRHDESDALLDRAESSYPEIKLAGPDLGRVLSRLARHDYASAIRVCEAAERTGQRGNMDLLLMAKAVAHILRGETGQVCFEALKAAPAWLDKTKAKVFRAALDPGDTESVNWVKAHATYSEPLFRFAQGLFAAASGDRATATGLLRQVAAGFASEPSLPEECQELSLIILRAWGELPDEPPGR